MTDNKEKSLKQDAELDLEKDGDKIVGGVLQPVIYRDESVGYIASLIDAATGVRVVPTMSSDKS